MAPVVFVVVIVGLFLTFSWFRASAVDGGGDYRLR
jgi:hypothetical protein